MSYVDLREVAYYVRSTYPSRTGQMALLPRGAKLVADCFAASEDIVEIRPVESS